MGLRNHRPVPAAGAVGRAAAGTEVLEQAEAAGYLLDRGLLTPETVVGGGLVVREVSSRNRNFAVAASTGPPTC